MIPLIAWRNIWRNKKRSLVIIASVSIGLWAGIFVMALSFGMTNERKEKLIYEQISHIQIHHPDFSEKEELGKYIPQGQEKLQFIRQKPEVAQASGRMLVNGMLSAPQGSGGVRIKGIYPELESALTQLKTTVIEGEYFPEKSNRIFIGKSLADKLDLKVGSKVVLTFQDTSTHMVAGAFRICALYKTVNAKLDQSLVYVRINDLTKILETDTMLHEIALLAKDENQVLPLHDALKANMKSLKVESWKELSPELKYLDEMMDIFLYIFIGIILFALAFGLVNTMLMAVLERIRELGMLMAIGLNKTKVFLMILLETIFLALTGSIIGFILGYATVFITGKTGINLSSVQQGMEEFGMSAILYPSLEWTYYPIIMAMVIVFAVLSAIYPAIKALQLNPSEAVRKV